MTHSRPFGGITCGDQHQCPSAARPPRSALYYPSDQVRDSIDSQLGRAIYEEFSTVVTPLRSVRHEFLQPLVAAAPLRHGHVQERHFSLLRSLKVGKSPEMNVNFDMKNLGEVHH